MEPHFRCFVLSAKTTIQVPAPVQASVPVIQNPEVAAELQSKLRLELAVREAIEANKREREARLAKKRKMERERMGILLLLSHRSGSSPHGPKHCRLQLTASLNTPDSALQLISKTFTN